MELNKCLFLNLKVEFLLIFKIFLKTIRTIILFFPHDHPIKTNWDLLPIQNPFIHN